MPLVSVHSGPLTDIDGDPCSIHSNFIFQSHHFVTESRHDMFTQTSNGI